MGVWTAASAHAGMPGWAAGSVSASMYGRITARQYGRTKEWKHETENLSQRLGFAVCRDATEGERR